MSLRLVICGLIFTTALVRGLVAYQISHRPVSGPTLVAQTPVTGPLMVGYLVAARPVPAGKLTRPEDFTAKIVPSSEVPPIAIVDTPDLRATMRGALVRHYVEPGMPLLQSDLMRPRDRGFLAAVLAPGMRAVSIGVDPVSGVDGLISPGDRVDVILTQDITQGGGRATRLITGEAVLANVAVSAIDQNIAQRSLVNGTSADKLAGTVTATASRTPA